MKPSLLCCLGFFLESPEPWSAKAFKHNWVRWNQCLSFTHFKHDFSRIWKVLKGSNIFPWYLFRAAETAQGTWIMSCFCMRGNTKQCDAGLLTLGHWGWRRQVILSLRSLIQSRRFQWLWTFSEKTLRSLHGGCWTETHYYCEHWNSLLLWAQVIWSCRWIIRFLLSAFSVGK